jgi:hypothetical protein
MFSSAATQRCLSPAPFALSSHELRVTRGLSLAYAVRVLIRAVLFSSILLIMTLPFDSIMESKRKCKSYNETNF